MRRFFIAALLFAPFAAFAAQPCKYPSPRQLQLDLHGVRGVQIAAHRHNLHVHGGSATGLNLSGRACASDKSALDKLKVTQRREGDQLIIELDSEALASFSLFGSKYAYLDVTVQLPADLPLSVNVGSGDADVTGVQQLRGRVGSGDLAVRRIAGPFSASVGSGDIDANDVGSLDVSSIGSGDLKADGIKGDARIGSIGSGDVVLRKIGGNVHVQTLGSGDLTVRDVTGDFSLATKGSGDVDHHGIKGKVSVPSDHD